jgi:hypothetical protein
MLYNAVVRSSDVNKYKHHGQPAAARDAATHLRDNAPG